MRKPRKIVIGFIIGILNITVMDWIIVIFDRLWVALLVYLCVFLASIIIMAIVDIEMWETQQYTGRNTPEGERDD